MKSVLNFSCVFLVVFFIFAEKSAADFIFSTEVPRDQKLLILDDLTYLDRLIFTDPKNEGSQLFKTEMTAHHLKNWLFERSHVIVSEQFDSKKSATVLRSPYYYQNHTQLPQIESSRVKPSERRTKKVVNMTNSGALLYLQGKRSAQLYGLNIPGFGIIPVQSPRAGIFKIGSGLFKPLLRANHSINSKGNSLRRLSKLFHEARHSDGNSKSLGFLHAVCPSWHNLAEHNACDKNTNGPYTVAATFLKMSVNNCNDCTETEKEALRVQYTDSYNRVIEVTATNSTNNQVSNATINATCAQLQKFNLDIKQIEACKISDLKTVKKLKKQISETNSIWDETPEYGLK